MTVSRQPDELTLAYEALRAQATGELPAVTPRGLTLFLLAGLPAWMRAWTPVTAAAPPTRTVRSDQGVPVAVASDVVRLLTEMALGCQRRWATR